MKKLFHRTHESLNTAYLRLHAPLSKSCPHESQQRGLLVETCIRILTDLGFLVHYPEGSATVQELVEKQEEGKPRPKPTKPAPQPAPKGADPHPWFPPALSNNPHARQVKF